MVLFLMVFSNAGENFRFDKVIDLGTAGRDGGDFNVAYAATGGPDAFGYTFIDSNEMGGPPYSWVDISSSGTSVGSRGDDNSYGPYNFGFTFNFYGSGYTSFYICNNGYVAFNDSCAYNSEDIDPANGYPHNFIAPFWDDFNTSTDIRYQVETDRVIVSWLGITRWSASGNVTFQVIMNKTTDVIVFQYLDAYFGTEGYDYGAYATVGMENSDSSIGLEYSYRLASLSDELAILIGLPPPPTFTQSGYRFFDNANSTDVGSVLAALNTEAELTESGQDFRLRMLLHVDDADALQDDANFTLQYVDPGGGTCASPAGGTPASWTEVTTSTHISFYDNATPTDGSALTGNVSDPTHSTDTIVNQTYEEANDFSNSEGDILEGQDGKWDFSLYDKNGAPGETYCLRIVTNADEAISDYTVYPSVTIYEGPDTYGYFFENVTYSWNDISSSGTSVGTLGDSSMYGPYNVGFTFTYYGNDYTQFYICNNGYITFTSGSCTDANSSIPSATDPDNIIAPFWDDLYTAGDIKYYGDGDSLVVSWLGLNHWSYSGGYVTFQIILYENGDKITFQYQDTVFGLSTYDYGATATVGIEDDDGGDGLQRGYNQAFLSDSYAMQFYMEPVYTQSGHRFFENDDSTDVGSVLADPNNDGLLAAPGDPFRLRMLMHVDRNDVESSRFTGKLQLVGMGAGSCASPSGGTPATWTDVSGSTAIAWKNNTTPADGASLIGGMTDPSHGGDDVNNQTYEESNNFTNSVAAIGNGEDGLWDFALYDYGMSEDEAYCFRMVESDGTALGTYSYYPTMVLAPDEQTLTVNMSGNAAVFGGLSFLAPRFADSSTGQSVDPDNGAHNFNISSSGMYSLTVRGATLERDGSTSISAITGSPAVSSPGDEQFGIWVENLNGGGVVDSDYDGGAGDDEFFYGAGANIPDEIGGCSSGCDISTTFYLHYLANIADDTEAGSYTTDLTYIVTGTF
ncbi:MAG: hypothetical protein WC651_00240 [Candidatus Gracilibacteria bacterium]